MGIVGNIVRVRYIGDVSSLIRANMAAAKSTGSMGAKMAAVAKIGALALAAAVLVLGKQLYDATKVAAADQASQAKLQATLMRTTDATKAQRDAVEEWIVKQSELKGISDEELRPAMSRLLTATHDVTAAQKLLSLAMDVSAGTGKSLDSVSLALMKGYNGQVSGLTRLGIKTTDASGDTLKFSQIVKQMSDTFGGQASVAADTYEGKIARLHAMFHQTEVHIGSALIPVLTELMDWFINKVAPAADKLSHEIGDVLGPEASKFGNWIKTQLVPALSKVAVELMPEMHQAMDGVRKAFHDAQPFLSMVGEFIVKVLIPGIGKLAQVLIPVMIHQWELTAKILGIVAKAVVFLYNNAFQPNVTAIIKIVGFLMVVWGKMLQLIGHVPGFGWVGNLGDKLVNTGHSADALADKIKRIPTSHETHITADTSSARASVSSLQSYLAQFAAQRFTATVALARDNSGLGHNAAGTDYWRGGWSWVGEQGPELVNLPRGSRVLSNDRAMAMAGGGGGGTETIEIPVVVNLDGEAIHKSLLRVRRRKGKGLDLG